MLSEILHSSWLTPLMTALVLLAIFPLGVGYLSLLERKLLADFQTRLGPMRVGPHGLLQPLADALKLLLKEDIVPSRAERPLFLAAPVISFSMALLGLAVIPFAPGIHIADVNIGLLIVAALSALGILGIILGGWSSNSHYALLGSLRSAAQLVSYEVALGLSLLTGVMVAGTFNLSAIVEQQQQRHLWFVFANYGAMILPCVVLFLAAIAETNRIPFDLPEAESELVAGYFTEFSGLRWGLYMLAEWGNILVISAVIATLFLGGWLRPFASVTWLETPGNLLFPLATFGVIGIYCVLKAGRMFFVHDRSIMRVLGLLFIFAGAAYLIPATRPGLAGLFWLSVKISAIVYAVIWLRGTLPRVRYDQLMNFGWKYLIPLGLASVALNAVLGLP